MTEVIPAVDHRPLELSDETAVLDLLTASMAGGPTGTRSRDFFRWKHRDNPFGVSPGLVATDGDRIVGVRMFLRWRLAHGGRTLHCLRAVDTATHPDYLRRGIFKTLTLELLRQLEQDEQVDLIFNTPNAASRPGYLRMGWQEVGTVPLQVAPLRPLRFLRGVRGASHANASGTADAVASSFKGPAARPETPLGPARDAWKDEQQLANLLESLATPDRLHTRRTLDYLRWRYADAPGLDYLCIPVRDGGRLTGLGFARLRPRASLWELTLSDVLVADGDTRSAAAVLSGARSSGADHVVVHASPGTEVRAVARRKGFLPVPGNGIRLVANPRSAAATPALESSAWQLALGDLEVF